MILIAQLRREATMVYSPECVEGAFSEIPTNLSRFSARSHKALLVILVIRAQPDAEGGQTGTGTEWIKMSTPGSG
jgi:hypothetical protein